MASGELEVDPVGTVLQPTDLPEPGAPGGPLVAVGLRNQTGSVIGVSARLIGITPELEDVLMVRASAAGGIVFDAPLAKVGTWSEPVGALQPGEATTLRIRFRLKPGVAPDRWRGHLAVRQLELKGVPVR